MILAIDYGTKKIGLAVSDETNSFAASLPMLKVRNESEAIEGINFVLTHHPLVEEVVLGLPVGIDFKPTQMSNNVKRFAGELKKTLNKNVTLAFTSEVLSTKQAETGKSRKFKKEKSDSEAARIFLQEYLDHKKSGASSQ